MPKRTPLPSRAAVGSFLNCEEMLVDALRVVAWCDEHKQVWSPLLTTVVMEACSQLDSLWHYGSEVKRIKGKKGTVGNYTIEDYFKWFGSRSLTPLPRRWVVFWGGEPEQIKPFQEWEGAGAYVPIPWWTAYNKIKHDRLANLKEATLSAAVTATAGLFLAILQAEMCRDAVAAADWLSANDDHHDNPQPWLADDSPSTKYAYFVAESRLFSHPVGWCNGPITKSDRWEGNASFRFREWFNKHEQS